ncbi:MAG: TetR/AcrR family transcriptional regulator [Firmicutes bacterium]|nr:TetR/AcrR family transcriptional regulator [Bacillota bacterium]
MAKTRISKEPEIRKTEIIEAAEDLFLTKGFEETTISDIVNKVGVAQGLFYYYFKSKDEILDTIVERFADHLFTELRHISNDDQLNAIQKLRIILTKLFSFLRQKERIILYIHQKSNELLHYRLGQKFMDKACSMFSKIIEQGVREKLFDVEYPRETTEILLAGLGYMPSILSLSQNMDQYVEKVRAGLAVIEKALGAPKGSLQFNDAE